MAMEANPVEEGRALGRLLVERGLITAAQLEECVREQEEFRRQSVFVRLGQILLRRRLISTVHLVDALREQNPGGAAAELHVQSNHISRYEILQEAGRGGMAVVYRALDREQARLVALKIMKKEMTDRPEAVARFNREASTIAGLVHPNIVTVYDYGEEQGQPFLVMELIEGPSLADLFKERTEDRRKILEILRKVALAAHHAHSKGIIHRDLKPANVLIDPAGEPRLTDFGLAHFAAGETAVTRPGVILGTPLYMAPEQVLGRNQEIDARTDVYALGALLYEAVTGRPPFMGESPTEVYCHILADDAVPPSRLQPGIPTDLDAICLTALSKERPRRYASAQEFADDLGRYLSGEPVRARRPSVFRKLRGAARRRPVAASLVLATIAVLSGLSAWQGTIHLQRRRAVRELISQARGSMRQSRWSEARDLLVRALEIDPSSREAAQFHLECVREMERDKDSLVRALAAGAKIEIILQDRESREANLKQVDLMIEETERELDEALRINPGLAVGWYQRGRLDALRWRFEEAGAALDRALALDPDLIPARFERTQIAMLQLAVTRRPHLPPSAVRAWKKSILDGNRDNFNMLLAHRSKLPSRARHASEILQAFLIFETSSNQAVQAIDSLEDAERHFHDPLMAIWIGILRLQSGDLSGAQLVLEMSIEARPYSILARWALARVLEKLGDVKGALEQWDYAIQVDPANRTLLLARAACLESAGRSDEAISALAQFTEPEARMARGRALLGLNRWDEAIREFGEILLAEPQAAWARVERARAWAGLKRYDHAVEDLELASALDPEVAANVASLLKDYRHPR